MKTCMACARYMRLEESGCPFCGIEMRAVAAPSSPWLLGLGLGLVAATSSACEADDVEPTPVGATEDSGGAETFTEIPPLPGASSTNSGQDTIDPDSWGEGATYGGPDETDSIGSTTGWSGDESTTHRSDWGEGATYGGPDESDSTEGTSTGGSSGSDSDRGSSGTSSGPG